MNVNFRARLITSIFSAGLCAGLSALALPALAQDQVVKAPSASLSILEIIERNKTRERPSPPETFPYGYEAEFVTQNKQGKTTENFTAQYRVNPNGDAGSRVEVISASDEDYPSSFKRKLEELEADDYSPQKAGADLWCGNEGGDQDQNNNLDALFEGEPLEVVSENDDEAVLSIPSERFSDLASFSIDGVSDDDAKEADKTARKFLKKMTAEITLDKPEGRLTAMRFWLPKPTRIKLIAKVSKMEIQVKCDEAPNGFLYQSYESMATGFSALGQSGEGQESVEIKVLSE